MRKSLSFPARPGRIVVGLAACALLLAGCDSQPERPRRMQTVKLLPDTPPPPPPKVEEKRPEPQKEEKAQPAPQPKPEQPPQQQALRSDESAGTGPGNGLVAGAVTQDYTDQKIGQADKGGGAPAPNPGLRLAAAAFANATTRSLNEYLARERELRRLDYKARVNLWLTPSGTLARFELVGGTGDAETDQALRAALERFPGTGAPPPEQMPQPLRVQVTNRMFG